MFELNGKNAVVTGAAKGIGKGIALVLAKAGANVVVADLDEKETTKTVAEIKALKKKAIAVKCDVSKASDVQATIASCVKEFGAIDILVNNAGVYPSKPFLEMAESDWNKVIDVNLKSTFLFSQAAARQMAKQGKGGKIVSVSSIASLIGFPGLAHYCASKGGINGLTRALALELAGQKINVNAVAPGAIQTPGTGDMMSGDAGKQFLQIIPWKRFGKPEDIAYAVLFLCSPEADYVTGQVLVVDGGWTTQ